MHSWPQSIFHEPGWNLFAQLGSLVCEPICSWCGAFVNEVLLYIHVCGKLYKDVLLLLHAVVFLSETAHRAFLPWFVHFDTWLLIFVISNHSTKLSPDSLNYLWEIIMYMHLVAILQIGITKRRYMILHDKVEVQLMGWVKSDKNHHWCHAPL